MTWLMKLFNKRWIPLDPRWVQHNTAACAICASTFLDQDLNSDGVCSECASRGVR